MENKIKIYKKLISKNGENNIIDFCNNNKNIEKIQNYKYYFNIFFIKEEISFKTLIVKINELTNNKLKENLIKNLLSKKLYEMYLFGEKEYKNNTTKYSQTKRINKELLIAKQLGNLL